MPEEDLEIIDPEDYKGEKSKEYSHNQLIMRSMIKTIDAGMKEMRAGYFNEKTDRVGNLVRIYVEDTRKAFIEAVKTTKMIMICDFDKDAKEKIKEIFEKLEKKYKELLNKEIKDWENCPKSIRLDRWSKGIYYRQDCLSTELPYYQEYIEIEVEAYRKLFEQLNLLSSRLNHFQELEGEA